jgi:hypothetical protein
LRTVQRRFWSGPTLNTQWIAEFIIERAMSGHFGYFKLVLDLVDGKLHRTAEDEMTFEPECVLVVADDWRDSATALAA